MAMRASRQSMTTIATPTPTQVRRATRAVTNPVWSSDVRASMSEVMRVMIRPPISRS